MIKKAVMLGASLIMGLGVCVGCGNAEKTAFIETETIDMVNCSLLICSDAMDWVGGEIILNSIEENAIFECAAEEGYFFDSSLKHVKNITVTLGIRFHWNPRQDDDYEKTFIKIVLKIEEHIGGYAVIEIEKTHPSTYQGKTLKSVLFPMVDGKYQEVTDEYVNSRMEKVKNG